jgi:hypothetical protein
MRKILLATALLTLSANSLSQTAFGYGTRDCSQMIEDDIGGQELDRFSYISWIHGFLTRVSAEYGLGDLAADLSNDDMYSSILTLCRQQPDRLFVSAVEYWIFTDLLNQ